MKNLIFLLFASLLIGCHHNDNWDTFSFVRKEVPYENIDLDSLLWNVQDLFIWRNSIVFYDNKRNPAMFCIDLDSFKMHMQFGNKGRGPNEFSYPVVDAMGCYNGRIFVTDEFKVKFIDDAGIIDSKPRLMPFELLPVNGLQVLNDSTFLVSTSPSVDDFAFLYLVDSRNRKFKEIGQFPGIGKANGFYGELLSNQFTVNRNTGQIAVLYSYLPVLQVYNIDGVWEGVLDRFDTKEMIGVANSPNKFDSLMSSYLDVTSNENYIIGLYFGKKISELKLTKEDDFECFLHVWNWNGQPLFEIPVNQAISHVVVDSKNNIYLINPFLGNQMYKIQLNEFI